MLSSRERKQAFYHSKAWQKVRDIVIRRDKYLCVDCLRSGRLTPAEEVHHIIPIDDNNLDDPSVTLNVDNLVSLCRECHRVRHGVPVHRYTINEFGHVIIR